MTSRIVLSTLGLAAAATFALAGCGADTPTAGAPATTPAAAASTAAASTTGSPAAATDGVVLRTASSSLGTILVDGAGKTLYVFDKDTANSGSSSCTDKCATVWPALAAGSGTPTLDGVKGTVGTIKGVNGSPQITLDGRPLYYFAQDAAAGDVTGQGVGGIWWVVGTDGVKITSGGAPAPASSS
jgi:predicted lipoprotein with Yx(FWY)xxD motif